MKRLTSFILHNIDITFTLHASLMCAILVIFTFSPFDLEAAYSKHSTSIVQAISARYYASEYPVGNLSMGTSGPSPSTTYYSGSLYSQPSTVPNYIAVQLMGNGLSRNDEGDIVVYLRRTVTYNNSTNINSAQPTALGVKISIDGKQFLDDYIFKVYFQYRGPSTEEYSSRIPISDIWNKLPSDLQESNIKYLGFFTLETNNDHRYASRPNKLRETALNSFDVLKIGANDNYSDTFKDRFHLNTDYRTDLYNYNFRHTQGIFDDVNSVADWEKISDTEKEQLKNDYGIEIPEFEFISNSSTKNKPICTLAEGQKLQPTHEVEHILYAMPGDVINLYPYYELYHTDQFYENFSHWYDYKTGGRLKYPDASTNNQWAKDYDMLDFLTEPEKIQISEKNGFFAGYGMAGYSEMHEYTVTNADQYIIAVNEINTHKEFSSITINAPAGLDFTGKSNVPMLGDGYAFQGIINGNGTTIKNLKYDKQGTKGVGLIGTAGGTVVVRNLIIDSTCTFIGLHCVGGIVGQLDSGSINVSDIKTEATVYGVKVSDQNAGGILGHCEAQCLGFKLSNCYIGGKIGNNDYWLALNAALIAGWFGATNNSYLKNIVVDCTLISPDKTQPNRVYIRTCFDDKEMIVENGVVSRGGVIFENCYGDEEATDLCWHPFRTPAAIPEDAKTKLLGWNFETMTPYMNPTSPNYTYKIGSVTEYINAVNAINEGQYSANIELTADIKFNGQDGIPMIGAFDGNGLTAYKGHFNGRGFTISGLKINKPSDNMVGMFSCVGDGAVIENVIIDESCEFVGKSYVGIIGRMFSGGLTVRNVKSTATIKALEYDYWVTSAGGILGIAANGATNNYVNMTDVYIGGKVIGKTSTSALIGYLACDNTTTQSTFTNVVVECEIENPASPGRRYVYFSNSNMAKFTNCYANGIDDNDLRVTPYVVTKKKYITEWKDAVTPAMTGTINGGYNLKVGDNKEVDHKPGTVATFFCPKNPYDDNLCQSLPFQNGETEYIIAADFSKTFDLNKHLDIDNNTLSEPVIAFRHIFRIRDGKQFAEDISGSVENNNNYIRRNQKFVSARCGVPFQIRLATPVPVTKGVPTNIYYKKSDNEYGRVCGTMEIILLDGDTRKVIKPGDEAYTAFSFGDPFYGLGVRKIGDVNYSIGDGNNQYYRMLKCTPVGDVERHYIVQLVATDPADPSKRIKVCGATDDNSYLIVAEYNIRFLPEMGATMLTMDALYDNDEYSFARVETLEEKFKTPVDVIDFDEYININTFNNQDLRNKLISLNETTDIYGNEIVPNNNTKYKLKNPNLYHTFFKWPIPWDKANYAYGYNYTDGYNMYMLATHSDMVRYKQAVLLRDYYTYGGGNRDYTDKTVLKEKDPNPVKGNENAAYHGRGLYDVKYYRTKRKIDEYYKSKAQQANELSTRAGDEADPKAPELEQGYFYWGNAASDPGVATRLEINDLCPGSTIHVSAWLAEFSIDREATNLSFNFVAVMKKDNEAMGVKAGDRIILHSFITGYVPDGGKFYSIKNRDGATGNVLDGVQWHWVYNLNNDKKYYDLNYININSRNNGKTTTTGVDDDMRGQWLNVYYSFVPRIAEVGLEGITSEDVYYELELDNNAKSSEGADFGIDDIRIYLEPPMVDALQVRPTCEGEATRIRMSSPFETLLEIAESSEALGTDEERNLAIYYTFIDKSLYETKVRDFQNIDKLELAEARFMAFKESVVKFDYNSGEDEERLYGKVNFKNKYLSNFPFPENMNIDDEGATETELNPFGVGFYRTNPKTGERLLIFESDVTSGKFNEGNQYYVLLKTSDDDVSPDSFVTSSEGADSDIDRSVWDFFDMYSDCANKNVISIKSAVIVRLNGIVVAEKEKLVVCENQRPVIQVNVWGQKDSDDLLTSEKELIQVTEIVPFDWFRGTVEQFKRITEKDMRPDDGNEEHTLEDALQVFRREDKYPEAESVDGIEPDADDAVSEDPDETPQEKLKQWMLDLIGWVSSPSDDYPTPRLVLCKESYTVPAVSLEKDEKEREVHVAVIPITCTHAFNNYIVCPNPKDITVTVGYKAPKLRHGLTYLDYPENMDVPLRIGLDQLRRDDESSSDTEFTMKQIAIPVRQAESSESSVKKLVLVENTKDLVSVSGKKPAARQEGCIVLLETNDPAYSALGLEDSEEVRDKPLLWIGDVTKIIADTEENANMEENLFTVKLDKDFQFKEGYYYTMRFDYADEGASVFDPMAGSDSESEVCQGQDAFTIKIVPRYLLWNGGVTDKTNLNWNNDNNWTRLDQDEIYSTKKDDEHRHYVTDGVNNNTSAYAPLDFTYVVVKDNVEAPYLYAPSLTKKGPSADRNRYDWPETPSEKDSHKTYNDYPSYEKGVGAATPLIQYDMAAFNYGAVKGPNDSETGCRPWYANTCYQIHFKPGGTIMNQQELNYNKAWVDVELDHSRWQTVSTPLQEVYAGDFYLPSDGARQKTELYQDITFDNGLVKNHRFKPAVFQRGWDKSYAYVYELDAYKNEIETPRNVAVKTFWSHVYNDVNEEYGGGVGFSIKTDISAMTSNKPGDDGKVLFRLPKADTMYLYWNKDGSKSGHKTNIERGDGHYLLNESNGTITVTSANDSRYFLVGNPFMTHMDIQIFLKKNEDVLEPNYWIVTAKGQITGSVSSTGVCSAIATDHDEDSLAAEPTVIPPMQGFFVKSKESATSLSLVYDETMMRRYDSSGKLLTSTTRAEETTSALKISSYNYGDPSSAALLITSGTASSDTDVMAMDNRDLEVLSTVYTAKAGTALSINFCEDAEGTEIGVIADEDTETVLRFEGVEAVDGLYLLDKADRNLTPLEEGMELTVNGAAAGRFFLTYGIADEGVMSGIEWSVMGGVFKVVDNAASGSLEVNVFDTMGRLVKHDFTNTEMLEMQLEHGMYVVEIRTAKECKSIKVRI